MDGSREVPWVRSFDTSIRRSWLGWYGSSNASWVARPRPVMLSNDWFGSVPISLHTGRSAYAVRSSDGSRMKRELHVRFCERPMAKLHRPTRQNLFFLSFLELTVRFSENAACARGETRTFKA